MSMVTRFALGAVRSIMKAALRGSEAESYGQNLELLGVKGVVRPFNVAAARHSFRGWPYVAAMKNAVAIASTPLRLYAAIGPRFPEEPKIAPFRRISKAAAEAVMRKAPTVHRDAVGVVEITSHPVLELLRAVNEFREEAEHLIETLLWLQVAGDAFWLVESARSGPMKGIPSALWVLPSDRVTPIPDKEKFIRGYYYGGGNDFNRVELPTDKVIHFREPSLNSQWCGYGRMEAAWPSVDGYEALEAYESQTARSPLPQVAVVSKHSLTPKQRREIGMEYRRALSTATNGANAPIVSDADLDLKPLSFSPREISAPQGRRIRREEIINSFDQTMGLYSESATRANADAAIYLWSRFGLDPLATRIAQKLNAALLPRYDGGDRLFFAFDTVATEDREFVMRQEDMDIRNGVRDINEVRADRGLEPLDPNEIANRVRRIREEPAAPILARSANGVGRADGGVVHADLAGVPLSIVHASDF